MGATDQHDKEHEPMSASPASHARRSPSLSPSSEPLLRVRRLCKYFPVKSKGFFKRQIGAVKACDNVSFDLTPGETLGLVGESGCGKTTTGRTILRALEPTAGEVLFRDSPEAGVSGERERSEGQAGDPSVANSSEGPSDALPARSTPRFVDLATLDSGKMRPLRTRMQMIFQDPFSSLNPRMTVGAIVREPLDIHRIGTQAERNRKVGDMLERVGLKAEHKTRYPHAFSGGQRQRIGIARALIMHPELVVCDEAVSALDVSVQAQVINLLQELQQDLGLTYIFIAHDLSVVKHICDRIAVMYAGRIVELAETGPLFDQSFHPYTRALLSAVPNPDPDQPMNMDLSGEVADPGNLPAGCAFHPRCPLARQGTCDTGEPPPLETLADGRRVACFRHGEGLTDGT